MYHMSSESNGKVLYTICEILTLEEFLAIMSPWTVSERLWSRRVTCSWMMRSEINRMS